MNIFKKMNGAVRVIFGFCPECNSSAPEMYDCKVCNCNKDHKSNWWDNFNKLNNHYDK